MKNFILLIFCFFAISVFSQEKKWSKEQLTKDVDSLIFCLEHSHPDLFIYCSPEEYQNAKSRLYNSIEDSMSLPFFAQITGRFLKTLKDSHTQVGYSYLWQHHLLTKGNILPIRKRGSYVARGILANLLPGDSIISINDIPLQQINDWTGDFSLIEGEAIASDQRMRDALFSLTTALFVIKKNDSVAIKIHRIEENRDTILEVYSKTLNRKAWEKARKKSTPNEDPAVLFQKRGKKTAYLKISTFAPPNLIRYQRKIKKAFKVIDRQGMDTLIIDIRGNSGGLSTEVEYLYSFIDPKGYNTPSNIVGRKSKISDQRFPFLNRKLIQWWVIHFLKNQEDIYNYVQLRRIPMYSIDTVYFNKPNIRKKNVFNKTAILWADALTASAGVDFTHHFHETKRGEHWGEPVMGPMTGTYGNTFPYTLPISHLAVNISTIRYNYNNQFKYSPIPIEPDYKINWKRSNFVKGEDPYWEEFKKRSNLRTP
jgi:Peptidase family S41